MLDYLDIEIDKITFLGPKKSKILKEEFGINNILDLLMYFPYRYEDRRNMNSIKDVFDLNQYYQFKGKITNIENKKTKNNKEYISASFQNETGSLTLNWFTGLKWIKNKIYISKEIIIYGKINVYNGIKSMAHPEIKELNNNNKEDLYIQPIYSSTEKASKNFLDSRGISKIIKTILNNNKLEDLIPETLNQEIVEKYNFYPRYKCFKEIHFPNSIISANNSKNRFKYEELFFHQFNLIKSKLNHKENYKGFIFENVGDLFKEFYENHLKFELTNAQKRVIKEIRKDLKSGNHMNRLLQGDVGSGKTIVCLLTSLLSIDNGFQSCLMAPTEILALQHFDSFTSMLKNININVGLLTGSTKIKERKVIFDELQSGKLNILIGTHALIEDNVKFKNLGLAIIDEQHKFGVKQRAKLWSKNILAPHILVMTATPIPRTLAMTIYGDLDISVIDELPPGRKHIITKHFYDVKRTIVFDFVEKEIDKGRQIYVVYPLIEESEKMDFLDLQMGYEAICRRFPLPKYKISIVHGKMKSKDKENEMNRFINNETQIMVATTVIEVGVNVANATIMIIESANKFGLSQLHQLRGRVGRGAEESYCFLITDYKLGVNSKERLKIMTETNNGFEISEKDLELRGAGNIQGTQQSGNFLKIANIATDVKIISASSYDIKNIIINDPELIDIKNINIRKQIIRLEKLNENWKIIS